MDLWKIRKERERIRLRARGIMDTSLLNNISESDIEKFKLMAEIFSHSNKVEVVTLRIFSDEYSNWVKQNRSSAYYNSVLISLKHLTEYFGKQKSIQSIGHKDVENLLTHLQQKISKGYRVYYRTLKAAFNKAIDWEYVKENYFLKVKLSKKQKVNPAYISSEELLVISDWIENKVIKEITITAFYTGMRLNELVNLTWRNVDLTGNVITVGDEDFITKGKNQRYIPICDEVMEVLTRTQKERNNIVPIGNIYVFSNEKGKKFTGDYISKSFKHACKGAGIDNAIHFHSLRHSFASNLVQKGVSLYVVKELLGHSSISTTEIYSHLNMDSLKEAIKKFDETNNYSTNKNGIIA